jgi:hypothetical protein
MESFRLLFNIFGQTIPDTELEWFLSMNVTDAIQVVHLSTEPAKKLYVRMKTSEII